MISKRWFLFLLIAFRVTPGPTQEELVELDWPREYESEGHQVVVFQPQIESWPEHKSMNAQAALALTRKGEKEPIYGAIRMEASTETNFEARTVLFKDLKTPEVWFPNAGEAESTTWEGIVRAAISPRKTMLVSLDRVIANFERSQQQQRTIEVNLDPPPIFRSEKPAILVMFLGEPQFKSVEGTGLLFATNTNWDLFLEVSTSRYFLLNGESWLTTTDLLKGPWGSTTALPADLGKLPSDDNWSEVRKQVPGKAAEQIPRVFTSIEPAELILTDGTPSWSPISETTLLYVTNTESDLFQHTGSEKPPYYFLVAGRWFRATSLDGPWSSAMKDLPGDFAKIPEDHPRSRVLAAVPGSADAQTAILMASIPRKATVTRDTTKVTVVYEGEPEFVEIKGTTTVYYAVNSPYDVFKVGIKYYCCHKGVWFVSDGSKGPWVVCTVIPSLLYTIPSSHPTHNVTYVYVYDSTPTTVVVGYTSGYVGQYVVAGALLFGAGYYLAHLDDPYHHYHHYHYHSHYFSYGCGARYDYYHGGYYRSGYAYGPHGGAGAWSSYNPSTGTYSRGASLYGPQGGSAYAREAYNPYTGNYAGRVTGKTPYGSWGRSVVSDGKNWARGGHRSGPRGTVGGIETSRGGKVVAGKRTGGSGAVVGKNRYGDVYVGKDGNVYKRKNDGGWQKRSDGAWSDDKSPGRGDRSATGRESNRSTNRSGATSRTGRETSGRQAGARKPRDSRSSGTRASSASKRGSTRQGLNRSSRSRQRGNSRARSRSSRGSRDGGGRRR